MSAVTPNSRRSTTPPFTGNKESIESKKGLDVDVNVRRRPVGEISSQFVSSSPCKRGVSRSDIPHDTNVYVYNKNKVWVFEMMSVQPIAKGGGRIARGRRP